MRSDKSKEKQNNRSRTWVCIVYPESAPENWRDIIDETHLTWCESPLHDKDVYNDGNEIKTKKEHWHILLVFDSVKSPEQVEEMTSKINATKPIRCMSVKGTVRYMAHLDNPEKAQYSINDIKGHGGFDVSENLKQLVIEKYEIIKEIMAYIVENDIIEFEDIVVYAMYNRFDDWFPIICESSSYFINSFLKSRRGRKTMEEIAEKFKNN